MRPQCPHCGGWQVATDSTEPLNGFWGNSLLLPLLFGCLAIPLAIPLTRGELGGMLVCGGLLFFMFFGLAIWLRGLSNRMYATRKRYTFRCLLCGYRWLWSTGQPLPPVQDRPDLRAAGEKRLEADRAAFDDAAAHYFAEEALRRSGRR